MAERRFAGLGFGALAESNDGDVSDDGGVERAVESAVSDGVPWRRRTA